MVTRREFFTLMAAAPVAALAVRASRADSSASFWNAPRSGFVVGDALYVRQDGRYFVSYVVAGKGLTVTLSPPLPRALSPDDKVRVLTWEECCLPSTETYPLPVASCRR